MHLVAFSFLKQKHNCVKHTLRKELGRAIWDLTDTFQTEKRLRNTRCSRDCDGCQLCFTALKTKACTAQSQERSWIFTSSFLKSSRHLSEISSQSSNKTRSDIAWLPWYFQSKSFKDNHFYPKVINSERAFEYVKKKYKTQSVSASLQVTIRGKPMQMNCFFVNSLKQSTTQVPLCKTVHINMEKQTPFEDILLALRYGIG